MKAVGFMLHVSNKMFDFCLLRIQKAYLRCFTLDRVVNTTPWFWSFWDQA